MTEKLIEYKAVSISRQEFSILEQVDFSLAKGEFVYAIGKVGSGKSSLMKTMYAELGIDAGSASVLGYQLDKIKRSEIPYLRRKIGIVFQDFQLLTDRSVYDNLLFVLKATGWKKKDEMDQRIEEVLAQVGMDHKGYKMPHELSGGEQQRIVIARAMLNHPKIILADEPTGNLDPETGEKIVTLLHDISKKGTAIIMATHNRSLTRQFPGRVILIESQRLVELAKESEEKQKMPILG